MNSRHVCPKLQRKKKKPTSTCHLPNLDVSHQSSEDFSDEKRPTKKNNLFWYGNRIRLRRPVTNKAEEVTGAELITQRANSKLGSLDHLNLNSSSKKHLMVDMYTTETENQFHHTLSFSF